MIDLLSLLKAICTSLRWGWSIDRYIFVSLISSRYTQAEYLWTHETWVICFCRRVRLHWSTYLIRCLRRNGKGKEYDSLNLSLIGWFPLLFALFVYIPKENDSTSPLSYDSLVMLTWTGTSNFCFLFHFLPETRLDRIRISYAPARLFMNCLR